MALYFTGCKPVGENLAEVLKLRSPDLPPIIQMCDALSRNVPKLVETLVANCNAHGRRNFVKVTANFPEPCRFVLETLGEVYGYDAVTREQAMSAEARLVFHQEHSKPVMEKLHTWLQAQFDEKLVEPNSGLGNAINYLLKHGGKLTLFLRKAGVPLDNNATNAARGICGIVIDAEIAVFAVAVQCHPVLQGIAHRAPRRTLRQYRRLDLQQVVMQLIQNGP